MKPKPGDPPGAWPMLVRFRDIRDPKSVEPVDPEHLDRSFGPGVTLRRFTVELTDDSVTTGIEKRLAWVKNMLDFQYDGQKSFDDIYPVELIGLKSR
jgi:hypothetical protein